MQNQMRIKITKHDKHIIYNYIYIYIVYIYIIIIYNIIYNIHIQQPSEFAGKIFINIKCESAW